MGGGVKKRNKFYKLKLTQEFIDKVKLSKIPAYKLAQLGGIGPSAFSKLIIRYQLPKENDERLIKIGKILGLEPDEIFEMVR